MASTIEDLLHPLPGDSPCGQDLSFSPEFDRLRELRREDDPSLDQGAWTSQLKRADWAGVAELCEQLLTERSKDLRIAGWYVEAATRARGFQGLADGVALYTGLVRRYWAEVHPLPEDGDQELRIGSITWLLAQVMQACKRVVVLKSEGRGWTLTDIELARQRAPSSAGHGQGQDAETSEFEAFLRAQRGTPLSWVQAAREQVSRLPGQVRDLQAAVDECLGAEGPGFVATREAVAAAVEAVDRLVMEMGGGGPAADLDQAVEGADDHPRGSLNSGAAPSGSSQTRAQALQQLRQVAEYFRRTEPHSPVAYLAERAASWGEMPLHAWLRHVMKDGATLAQLEELLGVPAQDGR